MQGLHLILFLVLFCFIRGISSQLVAEEEIGSSNITTTKLTENTCFEIVPTPGCSDPVCERYVCDKDSFCCERKWDKNCVEIATEVYASACQVGWPDQHNDCFEIDPFGRPGCNNINEDNIDDGYDHAGCENLVCMLRPECCEFSYDETCKELALKECPLPDPKNSCIAESRLPGCLDESINGVCLESICQKNESCCSVAYGKECVDLARKDTKSCAPKNGPSNKCYEESPYGGCSDRRCEQMICSTVTDDCCNKPEQIGRWSESCVTAANILCKPVKEYRSSEDKNCPAGYFCSYDLMANCTELADQYKDVLLLGNILGGVYCGNEEEDKLINCPRGRYCPDPETMLPCPAGYYCPYKTQEPTILCRRCQEGSIELEKDIYGWVILFLIVAFVAAYIGWSLLNRYNTRLADHISELEKRMQKGIRGSFKFSSIDQQKRDLKRLRPKLELISYRLAKMEGQQDISRKSDKYGLKIDGEEIRVDASRLFDILDADASGDLTFEELNAILGLSEVELREFIRRMNEMADLSSTKVSVTRPVFTKYFLQVLTDTSNLTISYEEAESMFDELADGDKALKEIHMGKFYSSSMSEFLSDSQILQLIKEFKILKANANLGGDAEAEKKQRGSFINRQSEYSMSLSFSTVNPRASFSALRSSRRPSSTALGINKSLNNQIDRRKSIIDTIFQSPKPKMQGVKSMMIERNFFVQNYPQLLIDVMLNDDHEYVSNDQIFRGVDLCFKDLSLSIQLGKKSVDVVKNVTGRIRGKTMTALMGGSGAGKTSLLNALCGRAHYGETTGNIYLNGHETDIQKHLDCIGFVPQDDIIYPELTVRENFIFSGRFRLPKGTSDDEIKELADETIANLGLARVANSLVGDVKRRGISGGEKKRVNIGIELMAMPSILFLDEPTSGLDASSALLVMKSLNNLVEKDGVTVVSVIHQPRKFIYDLFDSLILLGVGGQIVYHGPAKGAEQYFNSLEYELPKGESTADWLIDISSGRLEPSIKVSARLIEKQSNILEKKHENSQSEEEIEEAASGSKERRKEPNGTAQKSDAQNLKLTDPVITVDNCVGKKGVTTGKVVRAIEDAKIRRAWLCKEWSDYFNNLEGKNKSMYEPPEEYSLPIETIKHSFGYQFIHQLNRAVLVGWRNRLSKIINCTVIVGAVIFITALDGVTKVAIDSDPNLPFATLLRPQHSDMQDIFVDIFAYARSDQALYAMKVGIIVCIFVGLTATTTLTSKRLQFFREAGSGYDLNAYFFAINIHSTVEHSIQVELAALFAAWIRKPIASDTSYFIHFLLLGWLTVAWSMLFPMICSPDTVTLVSGFFFAFCGLIFSGSFTPFTFTSIYGEEGVKEFVAGWLSPTRFFLESLTVGEYRCLPEQSGFTIEPGSRSRLSNDTMMVMMGYAGHDLNAVRQSCDGWYWSVVPVICIGITIRYLALGAMHACFRAQQAKKPLLYVMKRNCFVFTITMLYCIGAVALVSVTTWLFMRNQPFVEDEPYTKGELLNLYGFFDE